MATMNVSLPDQLKHWAEEQTTDGRYANVSDYIRDLIRHDQARAQAIEHIQMLVSEGLESGISDKTMADIRADARQHFEERTAFAERPSGDE